MTFRATYPVRFAHCDPAGIAYFPRLLELVDAAVEDWTAATLGSDRHDMHLVRRLGLPTVDLRVAFTAAVRLGEALDIAVVPTHVGGASVVLEASATVMGKPRFSATLTQVLTDLDAMRARAWPQGWRDALERSMTAANIPDPERRSIPA